MYNFIFLIFVLTTFIVVETSALGLESNPWAKLDHYLKKKVNSDNPLDNIKEAESYLEQERQVTPKFGHSNKKLLATLELFLKLKSFQVGEESCGQFELDILKPINVEIRNLFTLHGLDRIRDILEKIKVQRGEICRPVYYKQLSELVKQTDISERTIEVDFFIDDIILDEVSSSHDEQSYSSLQKVPPSLLLQNIIYNGFKIRPHQLENARDNCMRKYKGLFVTETIFQKCLIDSCERYNEHIDPFFEAPAIDKLKPDDDKNPKTNLFFQHYARDIVCELLLKEGAAELADKYYDYYLDSTGGGSIVVAAGAGG